MWTKATLSREATLLVVWLRHRCLDRRDTQSSGGGSGPESGLSHPLEGVEAVGHPVPVPFCTELAVADATSGHRGTLLPQLALP